jgi:hypothetical protein
MGLWKIQVRTHFVKLFIYMEAIRNIVRKVVQESIAKFYIETHIDGQQFLGSDGTVVLHNGSREVLEQGMDMQINRLKNLAKAVKPYIGVADSIELKVTNPRGEVMITKDVTDEVTTEFKANKFVSDITKDI